MKFTIIFTILYFVIVIIELYLVNRFIKSKHEKDINDNKKLNSNNEEENEFICNELKNRLEKLKTMSYKDWLEYNQKNILLEFEKEQLYFFIYELSKNNDDDIFFLRTHLLTKYLNMERTTFESYVKEKSSYFTQHDTKDDVTKDIYNTSEWDNGCSINSYLWVDPLENYRPIIKRAISKKFKKEENGEIINGYISVGYTSSILLDSLEYYFEILENYFLAIIFLFIYLVIVINLYINKKEKLKTIFLFIILNFFSVFSLMSKDIITNVKFEEAKMNDLTTSVLAISFLVGVNIFIIDTLKQKNGNKALFYETSFLFCASIIALMLSIFKVTTYFNTNDIKKHRIENQIFFNISIIINIFILFNYFISIYKKK
jgi:hypothetical protein